MEMFLHCPALDVNCVGNRGIRKEELFASQTCKELSAIDMVIRSFEWID